MKNIRQICLSVVWLVSYVSTLHVYTACAQSLSPSLMPLPAQMIPGQGEFLVDGNFSIATEGYRDALMMSATDRFIATLALETGIPLRNVVKNQNASFVIKIEHASQPVQQLGEDESYNLSITQDQVRLTATNPLGGLHGLQTFLQLVRITPYGFAAPAIEIHDRPRFPWRGLMIDSGRHFMPVSVIKRNLDGMEAVKLNVFHWHLSEDQGFRVESKVFPLLHERGSNGQYYTQEQVKDVIRYARDRGIRVVPEFDMPCHTSSWFVGYPQLASGSGPYEIASKWGIFDPAMDPTRASTFQFLDRFIGEMTALFPDSYFHIGGDECNGKEWSANSKIQAYRQAHGMKDNAALQSYFTGRVQRIVTAHGKITEGWDEVLQPDTPRDVVIQSWRGPTGVAAAARQGNRTLLSNGYYIDLNQSAAQHYLTDPLGDEGASLTPDQKALVLGGEATMWSEFVSPENIDSRIWPRTAAIAERLWSPQEVRDVDSMYQRMAVVSDSLQFYGLNHQSFTGLMLQRMSGDPEPNLLRVLAVIVQPPEGYEREDLKQYDSSSPLNRLVDAVPPESETARRFSELVKLITNGKASSEQWQEAHAWLVLWRDNDAKLRPSLSRSEITAELLPLSQELSQTASIGLDALDALQNHRSPEAAASQANLQYLKEAEKPKAVLRNMVVPAVELLVKATMPKSDSKTN